MKFKEKVIKIFLNALPMIIMILLIPFIPNDYILSAVYVVIIAICFFIKYEKNEYLIFIFGFVVMIISEYLFISTGVETFIRNSLFGLMPLWLPILWAYGFVAIKRGVIILDK